MTAYTYLSHFVCWEKGVSRLHLVHVDTDSHSVTVKPYDRECADTCFCDGLLLVANAAFETAKASLIAQIKSKSLFTLPQLADYFSRTALHNRYCTRPAIRLYTLIPKQQKQEISLQEILRL